MKLRKINQVEIKPGMTVDELLVRMKDGCGFTGKRLGQAAELLYDMYKDRNCTVFLGLAGALIPGGMRNVIGSLIDTGIVDAIVTTGANITHDIIESIEPSHFHGTVEKDDKKLHEEDMSRIYDTLMPQKAFSNFEERIQEILEIVPSETVLGTWELLAHIGKEINDEKSILKKAYMKKIPIYSPSIIDSMLGMQIHFAAQITGIKIDILKDQGEIMNLAYEARRTGAIILAGGVPKHYIFQNVLLKEGLNYAIQITMDRPEHGGVSGASMKEAVSWGKVSGEGKWIDVIGDVTLILPFLITSLLTRIENEKKDE